MADHMIYEPCLVCGEKIAVGRHGHGPRICEHCRLTIMEMRRKLNASCGRCANWKYVDYGMRWCPVVQDQIGIHDSPCRSWRLGKLEEE